MVALTDWLLETVMGVIAVCALLVSMYSWRKTRNDAKLERERAETSARARKAATEVAELQAAIVERASDVAAEITHFSQQMNAQDVGDQLQSLRSDADKLNAALNAVERTGGDGWLLSDVSYFQDILLNIKINTADTFLVNLLRNIANGGTDPYTDKLLKGMRSSASECRAFLTAHVSESRDSLCKRLAEVIDAIDTILEREAADARKEVQARDEIVLRASTAAGAIAHFSQQMNAQNASEELQSLRLNATDLHAALNAVERKGGDGWLSDVSEFQSLLRIITTDATEIFLVNLLRNIANGGTDPDKDKLLKGMRSSASECRSFLRKMGTSLDGDGLTTVIDMLSGTAPAEQPEEEEKV
jgi:hypothetical protein